MSEALAWLFLPVIFSRVLKYSLAGADGVKFGDESDFACGKRGFFIAKINAARISQAAFQYSVSVPRVAQAPRQYYWVLSAHFAASHRFARLFSGAYKAHR